MQRQRENKFKWKSREKSCIAEVAAWRDRKGTFSNIYKWFVISQELNNKGVKIFIFAGILTL